MVVDVERVGDYTKNILDLSLYYPDTIRSEDFSENLAEIEKEVALRFTKTIQAINSQDAEVAQSLMSSYKDVVSASDEIVKGCISGEIVQGNESKTASLALYARYLKRIAAHLKNISSILVNPFEAVGYKK
jgi:phosphate uptake regulator